MKYHPPTVMDKHISDIDEELELRAMVASGDCFDLLASRLDQIMRLSGDPAARPDLEHAIRLLLRLQSHYKIIPKAPSDPLVV